MSRQHVNSNGSAMAQIFASTRRGGMSTTDINLGDDDRGGNSPAAEQHMGKPHDEHPGIVLSEVAIAPASGMVQPNVSSQSMTTSGGHGPEDDKPFHHQTTPPHRQRRSMGPPIMENEVFNRTLSASDETMPTLDLADAAAVEAEVRACNLRKYMWSFRIRAFACLAVAILIIVPLMRLATIRLGALPVATGIISGVAIVVGLVSLGLSLMLHSEIIPTVWNVLAFLSSVGAIGPIFLLFVTCVTDGIAPSAQQCAPDVPGVILLPIALVLITPHLSFPMSRKAWWVSMWLDVTMLIIVTICLAVARLQAAEVGLIACTIAANMVAAAVMACIEVRSRRTNMLLTRARKHDAVALMKAEDQLNTEFARNQVFQSFANASGQLLYEIDRQGNFLSASNASMTLLHVSPSELIGSPHTKLMYEDDITAISATLATLWNAITVPPGNAEGVASPYNSYSPAPPVVQQFRRITAHGAIIWVEMVAVLRPGPTPAIMASERDVTDERNAREAMALEQQRVVAQSVARAAHCETLGYACHELRNPLHVINASVEFLHENPTLDHQLPHLSAIRMAAKQMRMLVDDVLDVERLRSGKLTMDLTVISPAELVHDVVAQHADYARVKVKVDVSPDVPCAVLIAADRVAQVLSNGLTNAVRFCTSGWIRVRVLPGDAPRTLRFEVRHSGLLPQRPVRSYDTGIVGASATVEGLSMHIAASLVTALGGTLMLEDLPALPLLESSHTAPMSPVMPSAADFLQATEAVFWFQIPYLMDKRRVQARSEASASDDGTQDLGLHVLYVDDEVLNRRIGQSMLRKLGCTCVLLDDGDQVMGSHPEDFDVILLDIIMQRKRGDDAMIELRRAGITTPCYAVTGNIDAASSQHYLQCGFTGVMGKPFTVRDMRRLLEPIANAKPPQPTPDLRSSPV